MITADQQELFDTLVTQHGGADKLSRVDLEKILAIVKTTGALRQATGADVPRVAATLIKLSDELRRVAPKATGKLITAKMSLQEMVAEYQRAMADVDYEVALERDAVDQAVNFLRDKLSADDLREARRVIDHAVAHAVQLMRRERVPPHCEDLKRRGNYHDDDQATGEGRRRRPPASACTPARAADEVFSQDRQAHLR